VVTTRGGAVLAGAVLIVLVGRVIGVPELYVVGAAAAALVVVAALATRFSSASVAARRSVSTDRLLVGGRETAAVELRNESRWPATLLLVEDACHPSLADPPRFVVPGLGPSETVAVRYAVTGSVRGRYQIGPVTLRVRDPFGLAERVRRYTTTSQVLVYPRVERLADGLGNGSHRGTGSSDARRLFAAGEDFYTMREYVQGDDLRLVHWPSTAHRQTLMVRQQERPWEAQAVVLLDARASAHVGSGPDSTLEKAVSMAASVLLALAERGYALRLVTEETGRLPQAEPWGVLLDRLAELRPSRHQHLAPALGALRGAGGEGLLCAVLAPPPGGDDLGASPDVRALVQAGRNHPDRIALVTADPARRASAAQSAALARLLVAAGWRAAVVGVHEPLAQAWPALTGRRRRTPRPTAEATP
jgi:uncharacterized protein (DUF58 family)